MTQAPKLPKPPTVSFVVPCYKLAHLLPECIRSILAQSYGDLEVLIMDDQSPDATLQVASSFEDSRVRYIRNDTNLGHLRNYNRGIELSRGKYVWLISADDYLAQSYVLERYVSLMESNSRVGYSFCPGIAVGGNTAVGIGGWIDRARQVHGDRDQVFKGHMLLKQLLTGNTIVAASGLVRRECYERLGCFPLHMPWAGDWYLWCLFALHYDVGYFAEPMVCYREHELSMTNKWAGEDAAAFCEEELNIPFEIKRRADESGLKQVSRDCLSGIAEVYARSITTCRYGMTSSFMKPGECEASLRSRLFSSDERKWVSARIHARIGDAHFGSGQRRLARESYKQALANDWKLPEVLVKHLLLSLGPAGDALRRCLAGATR